MKLRTLLTWGLLAAATHVMGYTVTVSPIEIEAGQSTNLIINLSNTETNLTAYQMSLYLPEGVTVKKKTNGKYAYTSNTDRLDPDLFTVSVKDAADGSILIAVFSPDKDVITGTSGELIRLPIEVASTVTTSLQGSIKNIEFTDVNSQAHKVSDINFTLKLKGGDTPDPGTDNVTVNVPDVTIKAGSSAELVVNMESSLTNLTAYQMSLYLPAGVTVKKKTNGKYAYTSNTDRLDPDLFSVSVKDAADGSILIAVFSPDKDVIVGTSGELIRLPIEVASTVTTSLQGSIKNIEFTDVNSQAHKVSNISFNLTNSSDGDDSPIISFADPTVKSICVANWDINKDGELSEAEAAAVTSLGEVFSQNKGITSFSELQYFTGLAQIGRRAFYHCDALTSIIIPNSATSISINAFANCIGLNSINIPNSVKSIGEAAFSCCGLTSITIPNSVTSIHEEALIGCINLTSIVVEEGNPIYDSRNDCNAIVETTTNILFLGCQNTIIPNSVTSIGENAFCGSGLTSITIPENVTSIGNDAFYGCSNLASINIPGSVKTIGNYAFKGCSSLINVFVGKEVPVTIKENTFSNRRNATLYVPIGSMAAYESADYWKDFKNIVEVDFDIQYAHLGNAWIMSSAINGDFMNLNYDTFLKDMNNNLSFFLPTDKALEYYYDAASMKSRTPRCIKFSFQGGTFPVKPQFYNYYCPYNKNKGEVGTIGNLIPGTSLYTNSEVTNRLQEILESHTIVHNGSNSFDPQQEYYISKNGCPIKIIRDENEKVIAVKGGFQLENERQGIDPTLAEPGVLSCSISNKFEMDNGNTYVLNEPLVPTYRSVYSIFTNDYDLNKEAAGETPYSAFYDLCTADGYDTEIIGCGLVKANLGKAQRESELKKFRIFIGDNGLDYNVQFFDSNYFYHHYFHDKLDYAFCKNHYTIFVPTNDAVQQAIADGLPTWEEIYEDYHGHCKPLLDDETGEPKLDPNGDIEYTDELQTYEDSVRIAAKITYLTNFVRNHFAENSVFADKPALAPQEMVTASYDWDAGQNCKIHVDRVVKGGETELRVCDDVTWKEYGNSMAKAFTTVGEKNVLARDISCSSSPVNVAMKGITINTSSAAVIHSIPGCLNHMRLIDGRHDKTWQATIEDVADHTDNKFGTNSSEEIYDLQGRKLDALQKGINIIRYSDGTTKKVLIK